MEHEFSSLERRLPSPLLCRPCTAKILVICTLCLLRIPKDVGVKKIHRFFFFLTQIIWALEMITNTEGAGKNAVFLGINPGHFQKNKVLVVFPEVWSAFQPQRGTG